MWTYESMMREKNEMFPYEVCMFSIDLASSTFIYLLANVRAATAYKCPYNSTV